MVCKCVCVFKAVVFMGLCVNVCVCVRSRNHYGMVYMCVFYINQASMPVETCMSVHAYVCVCY